MVVKMKEFVIKLSKSNNLFFLLFVIFIAITEILVACGNILISVFIYLFVFISLLIIALYKYQESAYSLYLTLTLIPLIRIISVAIPMTGVPEALGYAAVSVPLFITGIMVAKMVGLTPNVMGFNLNQLRKQLLIALLGFPLGFIEFFIAKPNVKISTGTTGEIFIWVLNLIVCAGLLEEFLFRGILLNTILKFQNDKKAIYFISLLYAAMTISGKSFLNVIYAFLISLLFCRLFGWLKSILGLSLAHGLINITLYIICPHIFR